MSISKEAIEAGARAIADAQNVPFAGRKQLLLARAALTAAAPYIQAAALREFAHTLTAMITVYAERTTEYDAGWVAGMTSAIAGLTARADQLEGKS